MNNMIIKETTVWGDYYKAKNMNNIRRLMKKSEIIHSGKYSKYIDHPKIYAYKPKNQRGPARENQTFVVSYVYHYEQENLEEFIEELDSIGLLFYAEPCIFRGYKAHKIIIYENVLPIDQILELV